MNNNIDPISDLDNILFNGKHFLKETILKNNGIPLRQFYGATFTMALFHTDSDYNRIENVLLPQYISMNKDDSEFHWEFNNYALQDIHLNNLRNDSDNNKIENILLPLQFKNTPCTNWTLLRCLVIAKSGTESAKFEAIKKLSSMQETSGLIKDDRGVNSFQYHCFSAAMVYELYQSTEDPYFLKSFENAASFIRNFILPSGETLMIGRGQNQSFGYGALIYILTIRYSLSKDKDIYNDLLRVISYLKIHQRSDGSFPLTLNGQENSQPKEYKWNDKTLVGWYPYNNYYDYLPFMLFFIKKSNIIFETLNFDTPLTQTIPTKEKFYRDKNFLRMDKKSYSAVISKSGGYWTNDLTIPYITTTKSNLTPLLGGEQFQKSLYNEKHLSLPFSPYLDKSIRYKSISILTKRMLIVISPLGLMFRRYRFKNNSIKITSKVFSPFRMEHLYLIRKEFTRKKDTSMFFHSDGSIIKITPDVVEQKDRGFSASGEAKIVIHKGSHSTFFIGVDECN